ncbi:MAG TPA: LexA family transcriptional regulator [Planctomycetota bacterium]|nr:LexA family transcriptional regulator [Planctomycetota bacterium]
MSLAPIHRYIGRIIHLIRKEKGMRQSELASLTGLKQPNLSRIENGLVSPRQVTLEKIARALDVEVSVFFSESKVQEVERKWAASLGPKHAALMLSGKLESVPLITTGAGYPTQISALGEPEGQMELLLQFPPLVGESEEGHRFAMRVHGDSMHRMGIADDFRPGEVVVFSSSFEVRSDDFAFVMTRDTGTFCKVHFNGGDSIDLLSLNPNYPERHIPKAEVRQMWKLVRHVRDCVGALH